MPIEVVYAESFLRAALKLKKRYRNILKDVVALKEQLCTGDVLGDRIQDLPFNVYKVRIRNSDVQRGKSGGYRVIYYLETAERRAFIYIYSKSDQSDVPTDIIRRLIEEYEAQNPPDSE
jgi:mRNA-degrading endonuclease RelE of RelBE toxin-antitoxin system